jgi:parallel beta-helix repeat protein
MAKIGQSFALLLIAMLAVSSLIMAKPTFAQTMSTATLDTINTPPVGALIVPDQYPTIQDAIGNASAGDTIYVKAGTYFINDSDLINIEKPVSIIGENLHNTIIVQQPTSYYLETIIVDAPNVTISGFTFKELVSNVGYVAIDIGYSYAGGYVPNCNITDNNFVSGREAIDVEEGANFTIADNDISECSLWAIYIAEGINGTIINNNLTENGQSGVGYGAMNCYSISNLLFSNNIVQNNIEGLMFSYSDAVNIFKNNITDNQETGVALSDSCSNITVYGNFIARNGIGFALGSFNLPASGMVWVGNVGGNNYIFKNDFVGNLQQVFIGQSNGNVSGIDLVSWDFGKEGNYWSDYNGSGIYTINQNNSDHYPLTQQMDISSIAINLTPIVPELPVLVLVPLLLSMFSVAVILRHRKTANLKE